MADAPEILVFRFKDAERIPNHPTLPVLVVKRAAAHLAEPEARARWFETQWSRHGWRAAWRWGVYPFPHYHSTAHEILGVYRGQASLRLGDTTGVTVEVGAGDLVILPAGTGHENLGASRDFHVVGGYPDGQTADLLRGEPGERPAADARIARVPLPKADPLGGASGPLVQHWLAATRE